jgi:hypothetical protein
MANEKKVRTSIAKAQVAEGVYKKYQKRCEEVFQNTRSGHLPIVKFVNAFANYEIDLEDLDSLKFNRKK